MAKFEITAPNGQVLEIEGDTPPSEAELDEIFAQTKTNENTKNQKQAQPTRPTAKGVDLTPSGLLHKPINAIVSGIGAPFVANRDNISIGDAYKQNYDKLRDFQQNEYTGDDERLRNLKTQQNINDIAADTAAYMMLPEFKGAGIGARALTGLGQGALIGGLEGLKNEASLGSIAKGAGLGGTLGAGLNSALPKLAEGAGKLANKMYLNAFPGLKEDVVKRLINPSSKALDLDDAGAQRLLTNTTERVRDAYNQMLVDKGNVVGKLLGDLPDEAVLNKQDVLQDIDKIYSNYSLSKNPNLNPARNATLKEDGKINELLNNTMFDDKIAPQELYDINKNISNMVDWNKADSALKNDVLEQMYGANAERISNLSPALKDANAEYSKLMDFKKNEGIRPILNNGDKIDAASSALRNYKGNISQGNRNRNINDLENMLVDGGYAKPFLNDVDDVNAANELLKTVQTGFNPFGLTDTLKNVVETPILKASRGINRAVENIPEKYKALGQKIPESIRRLLTIGAIEQLPLQGGISQDVYLD